MNFEKNKFVHIFFKYFSEDGKDICRAPVDTGFVNVNVPPPSRGNPRDFTSESWEVDYGPSYNPDLVTENVPYVRMRTHLSRGDREAWKAQEHERIRLLEEKKRQKENAKLKIVYYDLETTNFISKGKEVGSGYCKRFFGNRTVPRSKFGFWIPEIVSVGATCDFSDTTEDFYVEMTPTCQIHPGIKK